MRLLVIITLLFLGCQPRYKCFTGYKMKCWSATCPCTCRATDPYSVHKTCHWSKWGDMDYSWDDKPEPPDYNWVPSCVDKPINYINYRESSDD